MSFLSHPIDCALLDDWQRDFPVTARPFKVVATALGTSEKDVIDRLRAKLASGQITRVGATCAPNTISASTLAAMAVPEERIEEVADIVGQQSGVNHSYLRENRWNLWFVATGPDRAHVSGALARIQSRSGLRVLDLRLVRPFNLDLGFSLRSGSRGMPVMSVPDPSVIRTGDKQVVQALMQGLPLVRRPYKKLADHLGQSEEDLMQRIRILDAAGIISRLGVIVRHRALGWRANAMVVWGLPHDAITTAGPELAAHPGVSLCYERTPVDGVWPYRLYSMIHARSRAEALGHIETASRLPGLQGVPHLALFSSRCFKQTGALVAEERKAV